MIRDIPVKAAQGKIIIKIIEVPQKEDKDIDIKINKKSTIDNKMDMALVAKMYNYHPAQAIVISNGDPITLKDGGIEHNDLSFGDLVILGTGQYDKLFWEGQEYLVIRTAIIMGYIKRDSKDYPLYAEALFYDAIQHVGTTISN